MEACVLVTPISLRQRLLNRFLQKQTSKTIIPAGSQRVLPDGVFLLEKISMLVTRKRSGEARSSGMIPKKIGDLVGPMGFAGTFFNGVSSLKLPNWSLQWDLWGYFPWSESHESQGIRRSNGINDPDPANVSDLFPMRLADFPSNDGI